MNPDTGKFYMDAKVALAELSEKARAAFGDELQRGEFPSSWKQLGVGDEVTMAAGDGTTFVARVKAISGNEVTLTTLPVTVHESLVTVSTDVIGALDEQARVAEQRKLQRQRGP